jgi:hypothetical protein
VKISTKTTNMKIEVDQIWSANNGTEFHIDYIRETKEGCWVHYTNMFTQQTYSCLEAAFRQRFTPIINRH